VCVGRGGGYIVRLAVFSGRFVQQERGSVGKRVCACTFAATGTLILWIDHRAKAQQLAITGQSSRSHHHHIRRSTCPFVR
jgi:hypothetical protein